MFADREKSEAAVRNRTSVTDAGYDRPSMLAPLRPLRYAASPLGLRRSERPSASGITAAENAAVRDLSHGRVDLHAIGASVHHVAETHPRLTAVGARSLTQGRQALIGDPADRGHEIWHLAQQAMGAVRPTTIIGGAPVNADARLEADADRMGAAITRAATPATASSATISTIAMASPSEAIQRQVKKFKSESIMREPPIPDLLNSLDYAKFKETKPQIQKRITERTSNPKKNKTPMPKSIEATIAPNVFGQTALKRKTHKSGVVGKIGIDSLYLESKNYDVYEGGHLIPHEIWTSSDPQAHLADDYVNLVPMSRNLNVGTAENTWKNAEGKITQHWKNNNTFTVKVKVDTPRTKLHHYGRLAEVFDLSLKNINDAYKTVELWNWMPASIEAEETTNTITFSSVFENASHNVHGAISSGGELVSVLKETPIWNRCDIDLQDDLLDL
ncbi:hypothetical protein ASE86_11295 [Sphingomonas sp. Leaf33]|uniref:hypothetical protein n=1 Tax=Sphingomonas sp. Leaf33 TaxID=1736215 RepID=UPI0006F81E48|nr:hypothetical protein [Sphingomonas sp. Leaf33]KQN26650.1 hypothetical protein ASE86_11295 [Sphingomonas sp. Leaf33]